MGLFQRLQRRVLDTVVLTVARVALEMRHPSHPSSPPPPPDPPEVRLDRVEASMREMREVISEYRHDARDAASYVEDCPWPALEELVAASANRRKMAFYQLEGFARSVNLEARMDDVENIVLSSRHKGGNDGIVGISFVSGFDSHAPDAVLDWIPVYRFETRAARWGPFLDPDVLCAVAAAKLHPGDVDPREVCQTERIARLVELYRAGETRPFRGVESTPSGDGAGLGDPGLLSQSAVPLLNGARGLIAAHPELAYRLLHVLAEVVARPWQLLTTRIDGAAVFLLIEVGEVHATRDAPPHPLRVYFELTDHAMRASARGASVVAEWVWVPSSTAIDAVAASVDVYRNRWPGLPVMVRTIEEDTQVFVAGKPAGDVVVEDAADSADRAEEPAADADRWSNLPKTEGCDDGE